jgi:metal-dependent amidase/aminoacylase/carboxypeptidase family protein
MSYDNVVSNAAMAAAFEQNLDQLGVRHRKFDPNDRIGSTDMGDVTQIVPAIHPYLAIAPESVAGHSIEFAAAANSKPGIEAMLNAARAMAMTCLDLFYRPELLDQAKEEFQQELAAGRVRGRQEKSGQADVSGQI